MGISRTVNYNGSPSRMFPTSDATLGWGAVEMLDRIHPVLDQQHVWQKSYPKIMTGCTEPKTDRSLLDMT